MLLFMYMSAIRIKVQKVYSWSFSIPAVADTYYFVKVICALGIRATTSNQ